ncbi:DUF2541 family protein [Aureisphaera galaxeae]|uniref:DUF2541 family protein n=1 Tax=Aureisphaera galaxeae TaxID=1538023 RepID=UPI002350070B|nr:DUF2541 family protein [Aureisphaera galaxeae]MDC8004305.1 DUF2541 family protein [Aureisphaera galaxeae]
MKKFGTFIIAAFMLVGLSSFDTPAETLVKDWVRIGTKKVDYKLDRDVMHVGLDDGRFKKLKLMVSNGNLNMHRMVVHYANGSKQEIELRHNFSRKSTSRVIDLKGNKRIIKKIVFIYDTKNASKRKAKLHVFGKH